MHRLCRATLVVIVLVLGMSCLVGCGEEELGGLSGDITIDGSSTVFPVSQAAAEQFEKKYPQVNVTVGSSGTGGGFKRFTTGETDVSDASRPIKKNELDQCNAKGVKFVELPVAYDGLTVVVNPANKWVEQLTIDQLKKIFLERGAATQWSDVNPAWPNAEIKIFSPGYDSGTFDYFKEVVTKGLPKDQVALRSDMFLNENDNVLVNGIAGEPNAIGYFGAAYYYANKDKLKAVKIVNPQTGEAVAPDPAAIESGEYAPFSRPLFIYVNVDSLKRPEMKKFVDFYLREAGKIASEVGYVALPAEIYELAKKHYEGRWAGTHFLTEEGEKRSGALVDIFKQENLPQAK